MLFLRGSFDQFLCSQILFFVRPSFIGNMLQGFCVLDIVFLYNIFWDNTDLLLKILKKLSPKDAPEVRSVTSSQQPSPNTSGLHDYVTFITKQLVRFSTNVDSFSQKLYSRLL